jgi:hypothetical protein
MGRKAAPKRTGAGRSLDAALALQAPLWEKRRAIVRALDKAYINPQAGYRAGQSDTSVQRALRKSGIAVELAEIKAIRAELFGPVHREIKADLMLQQVQKVRNELASWRDRLAEVMTETETALATIEAEMERICRVRKV